MCPPVPDIAAPSDSLGMLLGQVKSGLTRAMEQELATQDVDLRYSQMQTLKRLYASGPMSAGELARSLCHDGGAMTRLLDQLEQRGYLHRRPDPDDRRALRIELSASGEALCRKLIGCGERVLDRAMIKLDAGERRHLTDYLQRILTTLRHTP